MAGLGPIHEDGRLNSLQQPEDCYHRKKLLRSFTNFRFHNACNTTMILKFYMYKKDIHSQRSDSTYNFKQLTMSTADKSKHLSMNKLKHSPIANISQLKPNECYTDTHFNFIKIQALFLFQWSISGIHNH